jgi:hypothetical protein
MHYIRIGTVSEQVLCILYIPIGSSGYYTRLVVRLLLGNNNSSSVLFLPVYLFLTFQFVLKPFLFVLMSNNRVLLLNEGKGTVYVE